MCTGVPQGPLQGSLLIIRRSMVFILTSCTCATSDSSSRILSPCLLSIFFCRPVIKSLCSFSLHAPLCRSFVLSGSHAFAVRQPKRSRFCLVCLGIRLRFPDERSHPMWLMCRCEASTICRVFKARRDRVFFTIWSCGCMFIGLRKVLKGYFT